MGLTARERIAMDDRISALLLLLLFLFLMILGC